MQPKIFGVILMALLSGLLSGCMSRSATLNITVLNYTESNLFDVQIGDSYVQGYYRKKTGGGTGVGGVKVPLGKTTVSWLYDTYPGDPRARTEYFKRRVEVEVPKPSKGDRYLGVHIYPGDIVEFSLSNGMPWRKKQGEPYDHRWYMRNDPFYRGKME